MRQKKAIIIGAGPAGLTAAYELLERTDIQPIVYEMSGDIGGISKTLNYKGNRIDLGGHRFFSKSDRVMNWWQSMLPLQGAPAQDDLMLQRTVPLSSLSGAPDPETTDLVMLIRNRLSRIYYRRKFFNYPITLSYQTFANLGVIHMAKIGLSYMGVRMRPIRPEKTLEDFFINRFGRVLYQTFFRDYTRKVWGIGCAEIKPEWGAQRIKGLSIMKALGDALKKLTRGDHSLGQKNTETSLIEQFMYPKLGPGQLWEEAARRIQARGGEIHLHHQVVGVKGAGDRITGVRICESTSDRIFEAKGDYYFSSMPVRDLFAHYEGEAPAEVLSVAAGLVYRDFITVGLSLKELKIKNETRIRTINKLVPDNWIYIQESDVQLGRIQIFNNWSPYMVSDPNTVWVGLEYFCNEGDELWRKSDDALSDFARRELAQIRLIDPEAVLDWVVIRMPKTYPAYFGSYDQFGMIREFTDRWVNMFLIGRNGMHRYNNADHSMLTAMVAVDNIIAGSEEKDNIWSVNTEESYHEES